MKKQSDPQPEIRRFRPRLKYWQKTYLATLALFLICLLGGIGGVLGMGRRQNFSATVSRALTQQQYLEQALARDAAAVAASRSAALQNLYQYYGGRGGQGGAALEAVQAGKTIYSNLPFFEATARPEWEVQTGQRIYLTRPTRQGHLLFVSSRLPPPLADTVVTWGFNVEDYYQQWDRLCRLCWYIGGGVSAVFALALYWVLDRLYRPLAQLTGTARAIAKGNLAARAPAARKDEMGDLGRAMNQMAAQVQGKLEQLEAQTAAKQQLIDNLSHEMRTPLTAIGGWAETIQRADLDRNELLEATDTILLESRRVLSLSRQLLKLSVLQHEPLELQPVPLAQLFDRVARTVGPKARQQGVDLRVQVSETPGCVQADPALLESLLVNLLDNAVKACAPGGRVRLAAALASLGPVLTVTDDGAGMSKATLAHIGQPFYRADKARSRAEGGAGLGLALCFEIARRHGAVLCFESSLGKGTRASLLFTGSQ